MSKLFNMLNKMTYELDKNKKYLTEDELGLTNKFGNPANLIIPTDKNNITVINTLSNKELNIQIANNNIAKLEDNILTINENDKIPVKIEYSIIGGKI